MDQGHTLTSPGFITLLSLVSQDDWTLHDQFKEQFVGSLSSLICEFAVCFKFIKFVIIPLQQIIVCFVVQC